jgi:hypothetical protein
MIHSSERKLGEYLVLEKKLDQFRLKVLDLYRLPTRRAEASSSSSFVGLEVLDLNRLPTRRDEASSSSFSVGLIISREFCFGLGFGV